MIETDYRIENLNILLDKRNLSERYYPLIEYKDKLLEEFKKRKIKKKSELEKLADDELIKLGVDSSGIKLFRRFLMIYDISSSKLKEIDKLDCSVKEKEAYRELYYLPGVKQVRASLYYKAGYKTLNDIANSSESEIIQKTTATIKKNKLSCITPLPKEVRTHIAVAKAFTK